MMEWFKREWKELLCIFVGVIVATLSTDMLAINNSFFNFLVFMVTWLVGYILCHYLFYRIKL